MSDLFLLDQDLNTLHIVDAYESLIWATRYNDIGDCELMVVATKENFERFRQGAYIARDDDDMVCRIERVELLTDPETGNHLIITGYDVKKILSQRVIWQQTNFKGKVEDYIRKLITDNIISPSITARKIENFTLGKKAGFTETIDQQVTYDNLSSKIQELNKTYNWGYKVAVENNKFVFKLYQGEDRSKTVFFSDEYENLSGSHYYEDMSDIANVALAAGEGEGVDRTTTTVGKAAGLERYELYVDARDISKNISYEDLTETYPNGTEVTVGDVIYYRVDGKNVAKLDRSESTIKVELVNDVYKSTLESRATERMSEHKIIRSFEGTIEPRLSFIYKKDYNLGDIVLVQNEYGMSIEARITEIVEVNDNSGYSVEPKFEYIEKENYILTEDERRIRTEDGGYLVQEA